MNDAKIVIIYGQDKVDGKNRNGEFECLGCINSDDLHISCFLEFFQNNFIDDNIFRKVTYTTIPENIGYLLTEKGHIVFFNTTKPRKEKSGFFMIPSNITEEQKKSLEKINSSLTDFNIKVLYDYFINDYGLLDSKLDSTSDTCSIDELFKRHFNKIDNAKKM